MKKNIITSLLLALFASSALAQQDPLLSQYMFNHLLINPGYAGSKDYAMTTLLYRNQWVKLDGAPKTVVASLHSPVFKSRKVGLGLTLMNDRIGISNRTNIMVDYAYHIPIKNNLKIAIGIKAGLMNQTAKLSD
ncbi:MAG: PorP/SprF family type IX secretion system membrane protein, partial [Bacteroidota bacterium]